nr:unnamed protein product [Callosobruchus chinensis]
MKLLLRLHNECKAETGISDALATGVIAGKFPDDDVLKKHLLCIYKKTGFFTDDGHIQKDITQVIYEATLKDETKAAQLVKICAVEKDTPENTAFEMSKCVWDNTKRAH